MLVNAGQRGALNSLVGKYAQSRNARLWIVGQLIEREIDSTNNVTASEWRLIRDLAYPACDWSAVIDGGAEPEIDPVFAHKLAYLSHRFEEEINGQLTLL